MGFAIREALPGDVEALCPLLLEIHNLHVDALPHIFSTIEADGQTEAFLREQLAHAGSQMFVAEQAGKIVGYIWAKVQQTPPIHLFVPHRIAELDTLVVAASHRHLGVGRALVERAKEWAADQGVDELRLVVYEFNQAAIRFYEDLGYETGRRTMWLVVTKTESAR